MSHGPELEFELDPSLSPSPDVLATGGDVANADTARAFFDRPAPENYLNEWSRRLARVSEDQDRDVQSVMIFRLHAEWLAIATGWLVEITDIQAVHAIPHRTNDVLLGMVNVRGQLRLCGSLHGLFGVAPPEDGTPVTHLASEGDGVLRTPYHRMLILRDGLEQWVFPVEEVLGIDLLVTADLRKPPSTFLQGSSHSQAVFDWHGHTVGLLDAPILFASLRSHCQ